MVRSIVLCAALALVLAATVRVGRGQSREGETVYGARRFGPLYEAGRPAPPTGDTGWPADWDKWPQLSLEVFGATHELNATREYGDRPSAYGHQQAYAAPPYAPHGYPNAPYSPRGYGNRRSSRDLFSSDSGFVLRYGDPRAGFAYDPYGPSFGYPAPAYGPYPPPYGYGPYGGHPAYDGYGPGYWPGGLIAQPPGRYMPYFGW